MRPTLLTCLSAFVLIAQGLTGQSRLRMCFVGDIMGHEPQIIAAERNEGTTYDYHPTFTWIAPYLQSVDLAVGNLEVAFPGEPPYTGYPVFRSPDQLAPAIRAAGFDLLVTANNHANDGGLQGVLHTIDVLREAGFYQTGTFKNKAERDAFYPLLVTRQGFKLAVLNYTYDTNGIPTRPPSLVNEIDTSLIHQDMQMAKALKPDWTIVFMHWGKEYRQYASDQQEWLAQWLVDQGADMVVGAHPHVVQPITFLRDQARKKDCLVAYSLGNFVSNQTRLNTDGGLILEVVLEKVEGETQLAEAHYLPVWRYIERTKTGRNYRVLPTCLWSDPLTAPFELPERAAKALAAFVAQTQKILTPSGIQERKLLLRSAKK